MKRYFILMMILILFLPLFSLKNWKIYTNTTHLYDCVEVGDMLYLASWGGLVEFDLANKQFKDVKTNIDNLSDNDLRALDYLESEDQLLIGTYNEGIDRISGNEFLIPLTEIIGLASNTVNQIVHNDSLIVVATKYGVSVFMLAEDFPFPILINNYDVFDGLNAENITSLEITDSGYIICGSEAGINYTHIDLLESSNPWSSIDSDNSPLPDDYITSISTNSEQLAIGTTNGVCRVDMPDFDNWVIFEEAVTDTNTSVFPVFLDSGNNLWFSIGFWDKTKLDIVNNGSYALGKITPDNNIVHWTAEDLDIPTTKINRIAERSNGEMALLTWGESLILEENGIWQTYEQNSISASLVKKIKVDQTDKIWVCNGYIPPPNNIPLPKGTAGVSNLSNGMWTNYTAEDSPLISNNIFSMEIDLDNRKWFGAWYIQSNNVYGWDDGISIFDEDYNEWDHFDSNDGLRNNAIADLFLDHENRMWVCSFAGTTGGITVVDVETSSILGSFDMHESVGDNHDAYVVHVTDNKAYFGGYWTGLRTWNDDSIPYDNGPFWSLTPFPELQGDKIYDIITVEVNGREELWVASENGLFNLSWSTYFNTGSFVWYMYGTVIKRKAWYNNNWFDEQSPEFWYIEGQERIYGSVPTFPTALFADPFDRIWIGTDGNGISVYDMNHDTFTNYNMSNSPLISNLITDLAYDENNGVLYIGTDQGLHSVEIGIQGPANTVKELNNLLVYPNPFYPEKGEILRIENKNAIAMPKGNTICKIYDLAGNLIRKLNKDIYEQFSWDGTNKNEKKCTSGIYFYVVSTPDGQTEKGKIVLVR